MAKLLYKGVDETGAYLSAKDTRGGEDARFGDRGDFGGGDFWGEPLFFFRLEQGAAEQRGFRGG